MTSACSFQPLDDVADMLSGGTPRKSNQSYWNGSIPWLTPKDMGNWSGSTEAKVSPKAIGKGTRLAPRDTIFIVVRGMSLHNEIRVLRPAHAMTFNQDIKAIVARPDIDSRYLYYVILSNKPELLDAVEAAGHGTGRLPTDKLKGLKIPRFGSLIEAAIAELFAALDRRVDLNQRMNDTLESMARAIFKDWFVDFGPTCAKAAGRSPYLAHDLWNLFPDALEDEGKPMGWTLAPLSVLAKVNPESWSNKNAPEEILYVDLANTKWGSIDATQRFQWRDAPSRAKRVLRSGDSIVGLVRPGNGSYALIGVSGLTGSTGFAVLRPRKPRYRELVFLAATAPENIERLAHLADGAAYPAVRPEAVEATENVIADNAVTTRFSALVAPIIDRMECNKIENQSLAQIRDLLLPKLMSGEIRLGQAEKVVERVA